MSIKKILYFDMDNVLVDFSSGVSRLSEEMRREYEGRLDDAPGIFSLMEPLPDAIEAVKVLSQYFDCYILSVDPWKNPAALKDKQAWVKKYFGDKQHGVPYKHLLISHRKDLNKGGYLIDNHTKNGAGEFEGELIMFGSKNFTRWYQVVHYLLKKEISPEVSKKYIYQEALRLTKEIHGENSTPVMQISSPEWFNIATEANLLLLVSFLEHYSAYMKKGLKVVYSRIKEMFGINSDVLEKVEFGRVADETYGVLIRNFQNNRFYVAKLQSRHIDDNDWDFDILLLEER